MSKNSQAPAPSEPRIIRRKEMNRIELPYSAEQMQEFENELDKYLKDRFKAEQKILEAKEDLKTTNGYLESVGKKIRTGTYPERVECDVEIRVDEKKKLYFYEGNLVETEEMDDYEVQLEIEDQQENEEQEEQEEEQEETEE